MSEPCAVCGLPLEIGQWPCITTPRPHDRSVQLQPFVPYFDYGLGEYVTSLGDRWAAMKRHGLDYKDHPTKGDLSARRDRIEQQKAAR